MRALSIFPDGFSADAAERLLGDDALPILEHLIDQSLVKTGTRFRMLETVREFSAARREEAGETERAVAGFLAWARDFARANHETIFGPDPFAAAARIRAEQDNLMSALRFGLARDDSVTVIAAAAALGPLWFLESDYHRIPLVSEDVSRVLSHFRPEPRDVDLARMVATMETI